MPSPKKLGLPCLNVRRSERIQNKKEIRPKINTTEVEYNLTRVIVPADQPAESPKPSTSEEQIGKGASRYSIDSGFNFTEYRDPTLEISDNSSVSGSEGQSISLSPDQKGTHEVVGLKAGEFRDSTDLNLTKTPTTGGDELGSILEELEESLYRSQSLGQPLDLGKEGSSNLDHTTLVLATGISTPLVGQRRYDSSNRTLLFDLFDPQTTGSSSGTVRSQGVPEIRDPEDYRNALDMSAKAREPIFFLGRLKKTPKIGLNALKNSAK